MPDLICDCGKEPTVYIDMSEGPGMICQVRCECGRCGREAWDVLLPWNDLKSDWENEREARTAVKDGLLERTRYGYRLTDAGRERVRMMMHDLSPEKH